MLKYLIIPLSDDSVSFCNYEVKGKKNLIPLETLKKAIIFAMKKNLTVQFIYNKDDLPQEYASVIESIDNTKIYPVENKDIVNAEVVVFSNIDNFLSFDCKDKTIILHLGLENIENLSLIINNKKADYKKLNIVFDNEENITNEQLEIYHKQLKKVADFILKEYNQGNTLQLNILTDRILLTQMNNCNAGKENITLMPNGKFYICPAFYYENERDTVGDLNQGLNIKNAQLYEIEYAPICRICDSFHCKRCVYINKKMTYEVNTPSKQQCIISHIERNVSKYLLDNLQAKNIINSSIKIEEIDYLDPFEKIVK